MTSPRLSIIIANYNNGPYLEQCLSSVGAQTFSDYEVLVADAASTDNSLAIIEAFAAKDARIRLLTSTEVIGVAENRDRAFKVARGHFATTLDSDDFFYSKDKLLREMKLVEQPIGTQKPICSFSKIMLVDPDGQLMHEQPGEILEGDIFMPMLERSCLIPRDFIMPLEIYFELGGFDTSFHIYEDWDLKLRLAQVCDFRFSGEPGTAYRRHGSGLSSAGLKAHYTVFKRIYYKYRHQVPAEARPRLKKRFRGIIREMAANRLGATLYPRLRSLKKEGRLMPALFIYIFIVLQKVRARLEGWSIF